MQLSTTPIETPVRLEYDLLLYHVGLETCTPKASPLSAVVHQNVWLNMAKFDAIGVVTSMSSKDSCDVDFGYVVQILQLNIKVI